MTPSELEQRLNYLKSIFPQADLTPNTFLQLVKPTDELLLPYQQVLIASKIRINMARMSLFSRIMINVFKSVGVSLIRTGELRSWRQHRVEPKGTLIVSHFTHAQQPGSVDAFFGDLLNRKAHNVFYLNSTRIEHDKLLDFYPKDERKNLIFMTKSLPLSRVMSLHIRYFVLSLILFKHSFHRTHDLINRWLLIETAVQQHSRATLANKFFEIRLTEMLKSIRPAQVSLTFEGHAHEAVLIELIHKSFPEIKIVPYQHAPVVPEQFGILRNLRILNANDKVLTSGEITKEYFSAFRTDISILAAGSSKFKEPAENVYVNDRIKVIGASEGTIQSLEVFIKLFNNLAAELPSLDFSLRVHPAISERELGESLKRLHSDSTLISQNSLVQDLATSTYCIYRSSAVAIEGLAFGVTPLYFDQSRSQGLNPLYFANLHLPVFGAADELAEFFKSLSRLDSSAHGIDRVELQRISNQYFSKISSGTRLI
jgi:hypothetical protein